MGHWFDRFDDDTPWRKTPAKINGKWYTPHGEEIHDTDAYFNKVRRNGEYWKGNTGWNANRKRK